MALEEVRQALSVACAVAGRPAGSVTLIAVSKLQPLDRVQTVLAQGHRVFGENYVQEAAAKWPGLSDRFGKVVLHMVGPLQTNKARQAVELFDVIHTLDRPSLLDKFARLAQARGASPGLFVQVNTGEEPQKAGVLPGALDTFVAGVRSADLPILGLMCIPPEAEDPVPHFRMLADMARRNGLSGLSMGMSADFAPAVAEGATHVRIGSAIFGARVAA